MAIWHGYTSWSAAGRLNGKVAYIPIYGNTETPISLPKLFWSTAGREFNTVTHAKVISPHDCELFPTYMAGNYLLPQIHLPLVRMDTQRDLGSPAYTCWISGPDVAISVNFAGSYRNGKWELRFHIYLPPRPGRTSVRGWREFGPTVSGFYDRGCPSSALKSHIIAATNAIKSRFSRQSSFSVSDYMWDMYDYCCRYVKQWGNGSSFANYPVSNPTRLPGPTESSLQSGYLFGEQNILSGGLAPGSVFSSSNYWKNYARQHAFLDACESMPRLSDNSISNLSEIFEFLLSVIRREPPKLPKSLGDAWLAYRYQYSTTKMDIAEAISFIDRYVDLGSLSSEMTSRGTYSFSLSGVDVTCRCRIIAIPRQILTLKNILSDLRTAWYGASVMGLAPDLYYLWDSTPFSFIADWFLPIGNVLAMQDASLLYTGTNFDFKLIEYSLKYQRDIDGYTYQYYTRWYEDNPPKLSGFYWIEPPSANPKQILYRSLDTVSLFLGGIKL